MLKRYQDQLRAHFVTVDFLLMILSGVLAVLMQFFWLFPQKLVLIPDLFGWFPQGTDRLLIYWFLVGVASSSQIVIFLLRKNYDNHLRIMQEEHALLRLIPSIGMNFVIIAMVLYFLRLADISRLVLIYYFILALFLIPSGRYIVLCCHSYWGKKRAAKNTALSLLPKVLLIGFPAKMLFTLLENMQQQKFFANRGVAAFLARDSKLSKKLLQQNIEFLPNMKRVFRLLEEEEADMVLMHGPLLQKSRMPKDHAKRIRSLCDQMGIELLFVSPMTLTERGAHFDWAVQFLDHFLIMKERLVPLDSFFARIQKRLLDIVGATAILLFCAPLFVLAAIVIKCDSPGPIFFSQKRTGQDGKLFSVLKFRSMRVQGESESDRRWGRVGDQRITAFGAFLRRFGLDELPQFWNVWKGDMSIVGPRPERPYFVRRFSINMHDYMRRHSVKSGITGLAQIKGYRGDSSIEKRLEYDIRYIENWTILLDLWIILCTPFIIHKNVNG